VQDAQLMPPTHRDPLEPGPEPGDHGQDDEGWLLVRARNGDHDAFGELVHRTQRRVWRVCRQYLGADDADAATQDSFVKAYTNLGSFDGRAAFSTWLTRIAINTCLDELRRRRREGQRIEAGPEPEAAPGADGLDPLDQIADDDGGPEDRAIQRQAVARLRRSEAGLPERQREIFRLRFYAELELDQIATALGVHIGTVKTQLHRAVHRLRAELGDVR
jgi:RNA polymerase sigma-70 factor (ECF subfamily)